VWNGRQKLFKGDIPPLSWPALADLGQAIWRIDRVASRLRGAAPWSHPDAALLDRQSVGAWLHCNTFTQQSRFFFELVTSTEFGCPS
jgi:monoamine oxidase